MDSRHVAQKIKDRNPQVAEADSVITPFSEFGHSGHPAGISAGGHDVA